MKNSKKILAILLSLVVISTVAIISIGKEGKNLNSAITEPYYDDWFEFFFDDCYIDDNVEDIFELRTGPGTEYELIDTVSPDDEIEVLGFSESSSYWLYVNCDGKIGWILNNVIDFANVYELNASDFKYNYICRVKFENTDADLNVYSSSNTDSNVLLSLSEGDIVKVYSSYNDDNNGFIEIVSCIRGTDYSGNATGWIAGESLEKIGRLGETHNNNEYANKKVYKVSEDLSPWDELCDYKPVVVNADKSIKLKSGPKDDYKKVAVVEPMSIIYIIGKTHSTDEWALVYCPIEDKHGWVEVEYLDPVDDVSVVEDSEGVTVDGKFYEYVGSEPIISRSDSHGLAFMSTPDDESRCIFKIQKGTKFLDSAPCGDYPGWTFAEYNDGLTQHYGFVYIGE